VVLIVIVVLFVVFVGKGALSHDKQTSGKEMSKQEKPAWSKKIKNLFSSLQPKVELKRKVYSGNSEEEIAADKKLTFRTVTFHLINGAASIKYKDRTENPPEGLDDQTCPLPNFDGDDITRCSIVVLKRGGTLTFNCQGTNPCRVEVE
jgi:hypothetical protein